MVFTAICPSRPITTGTQSLSFQGTPGGFFHKKIFYLKSILGHFGQFFFMRQKNLINKLENFYNRKFKKFIIFITQQDKKESIYLKK